VNGVSCFRFLPFTNKNDDDDDDEGGGSLTESRTAAAERIFKHPRNCGVDKRAGYEAAMRQNRRDG